MERRKEKIYNLVEWGQNPREISKDDLETLKKSILRNPEMLAKRPLLVADRNGVLMVYAGNQRLRAVRELGWDEVDVIVDKDISDEKMKEQAMIDNVQWGKLVLDKIPELKLDEEFLSDLGIELPEEKEISEKPEVEFSEELLESRNYLVLYFDNDIDWVNLQSLYPLEQKKAIVAKFGLDKMGVGRVVKGTDFINKLLEK